jgi:hypothetical protein
MDDWDDMDAWMVLRFFFSLTILLSTFLFNFFIFILFFIFLNKKQGVSLLFRFYIVSSVFLFHLFTRDCCSGDTEQPSEQAGTCIG